MTGRDEYERLAEWSEHRGTGDYRPKMEWAPIWLGLALTAVLGLGMYWTVRAVAWVIARGWF